MKIFVWAAFLVTQAAPAWAVPAVPTTSATQDEQEQLEEEVQLDDVVEAEAAPESPALSLHGYVDVGYARAQGNGTSFSPLDTRAPADYRVDTFAPAVNSRGDVASTDPQGRFVNGFLPYSTGQGGKPSFLLNVLNLDTRYEPKGTPLTAFGRVQFMPRHVDGRDASRFFVEQAFGRLQPFAGQEFTISVGKFDSVFGIEYLENQSNFRIGITPSLFARYTTGTSVGVKMFYRLQVPALWSALSLNTAVTNHGNYVEPLQTSSRSLTGKPVASARLGYELNLPKFGIKLGASGMYGPRNDQSDAEADQRMFGFDARVFVFGLTLSGEYINVTQGLGGPEGKQTSLGPFPLASGFLARGFYGQAAYTLQLGWGPLRRITAYGRYERRHAAFTGFGSLDVDRLTTGIRFDLWDFMLLKAEMLRNGEVAGAPKVRNDVLTSSVVFSW